MNSSVVAIALGLLNPSCSTALIQFHLPGKFKSIRTLPVLDTMGIDNGYLQLAGPPRFV